MNNSDASRQRYLCWGAPAPSCAVSSNNPLFPRIPAGRDVFVEGDRAEAIALLLSGVVRVYKLGETGRQITLYRFGLGESCILTANAILSQGTFPAIASVEQDAEAVMIPADVFRQWVQKHDLWRGFVFDLLSQRLASVLAIVDEVAFRRMDARLAAFLLRRGQLQNPLRLTHQEIAAELGSSRGDQPAVGRFPNAGRSAAYAGEVEILDFQELENQAVV